MEIECLLARRRLQAVGWQLKRLLRAASRWPLVEVTSQQPKVAPTTHKCWPHADTEGTEEVLIF